MSANVSKKLFFVSRSVFRLCLIVIRLFSLSSAEQSSHQITFIRIEIIQWLMWDKVQEQQHSNTHRSCPLHLLPCPGSAYSLARVTSLPQSIPHNACSTTVSIPLSNSTLLLYYHFDSPKIHHMERSQTSKTGWSTIHVPRLCRSHLLLARHFTRHAFLERIQPCPTPIHLPRGLRPIRQFLHCLQYCPSKHSDRYKRNVRPCSFNSWFIQHVLSILCYASGFYFDQFRWWTALAGICELTNVFLVPVFACKEYFSEWKTQVRSDRSATECVHSSAIMLFSHEDRHLLYVHYYHSLDMVLLELPCLVLDLYYSPPRPVSRLVGLVSPRSVSIHHENY